MTSRTLSVTHSIFTIRYTCYCFIMPPQDELPELIERLMSTRAEARRIEQRIEQLGWVVAGPVDTRHAAMAEEGGGQPDPTAATVLDQTMEVDGRSRNRPGQQNTKQRDEDRNGATAAIKQEDVRLDGSRATQPSQDGASLQPAHHPQANGGPASPSAPAPSILTRNGTTAAATQEDHGRATSNRPLPSPSTAPRRTLPPPPAPRSPSPQYLHPDARRLQSILPRPADNSPIFSQPSSPFYNTCWDSSNPNHHCTGNHVGSGCHTPATEYEDDESRRPTLSLSNGPLPVGAYASRMPSRRKSMVLIPRSDRESRARRRRTE